MFRYELITIDGGALGVVAFARRDFQKGDTIPGDGAGNLRVVNVLEPVLEGQLPVLVVEQAE